MLLFNTNSSQKFYFKGDTMTKDLKILKLTGSYGNRHLKVSNTLNENFLKLGMNQVIVSDLYLDAHPLITKTAKYLYLKSFTYGRKL